MGAHHYGGSRPASRIDVRRARQVDAVPWALGSAALFARDVAAHAVIVGLGVLVRRPLLSLVLGLTGAAAVTYGAAHLHY